MYMFSLGNIFQPCSFAVFTSVLKDLDLWRNILDHHYKSNAIKDNYVNCVILPLLVQKLNCIVIITCMFKSATTAF